MNWVRAQTADADRVFGLMRDFYAEEELDFDEARIFPALREMLSDTGCGVIFLLDGAGGASGYFVASLGFSLEFGGRFALLDELFLVPSVRGRGEARRAMAEFESWARGQGVRAVRLEVNQHNNKARAFYVKAGYADDARQIMSQWLD